MKQQQPFILLIDDDEEDMEMLTASLNQVEVNTRCLRSGEEVAFYLRAVSAYSVLPSLIILDFNMPRINGKQILALLKSNRITENIPVVMYSTYLSMLFRESLQDLGAINCFTKPWNQVDYNRQAAIFKTMAQEFAENRNSLRKKFITTAYKAFKMEPKEIREPIISNTMLKSLETRSVERLN